jgi:hypothetical protein
MVYSFAPGKKVLYQGIYIVSRFTIHGFRGSSSFTVHNSQFPRFFKFHGFGSSSFRVLRFFKFHGFHGSSKFTVSVLQVSRFRFFKFHGFHGSSSFTVYVLQVSRFSRFKFLF